MVSQELEEKGITFSDLVVYFRDHADNLQLPVTAIIRMMGETGGRQAWEGFGFEEDQNLQKSTGGPTKDFMPGWVP